MRRAGLVLLGLLTAVVPAGPAPGATQREVEEALTCQCGCGLTVHSCNHLQCGSGEPMKQEIAERIARGEDTATILEGFRTRYGEKVLSSPTFRGFNWLAWITPFAAVLTGAVGVTLVIRRWVRTPAPAAPAGGAGGSAVGSAGEEALRARLARELADMDRDA